MDATSSMDTSSTVNTLARFLGTANELPDDNEIKEGLKQKDTAQTKTEDDSDVSDDSDVEGSLEQAIWDALFPNDKPYENTLEDLIKLKQSLPTRFSTRQRHPNIYLYDEASLEKVKKILESPLINEEIDQEILIENLQRMRVIIEKRIEKKTKELAKVRECVIKLERMAL